jgi:hypothetical protein
MRFFFFCSISSLFQRLLAPADAQQWMGPEALSLACACACTPRILLRVLRDCCAAPASLVSLSYRSASTCSASLTQNSRRAGVAGRVSLVSIQASHTESL